MSINEIIINALSKFNLPIALNNYKNKDNLDMYLVWNVSDDRCTYYADNEPLFDTVSVQVHLFIKDNINYLQLKKDIRNSLCDSNFTYPSVTMLHEDEEKLNHIVFECEINITTEREEK